jgi:hypothetical protein
MSLQDRQMFETELNVQVYEKPLELDKLRKVLECVPK